MAARLIRRVLLNGINIKSFERTMSSRSHFPLRTSAFATQNMASIRKLSSVAEKFEDAQLKLKTITEEPSNDVKLKLYSLFKQATVGPCQSGRPSVLDFVGRAKWDAWNSLGSMPQVSRQVLRDRGSVRDEAKLQYAALIGELLGARQDSSSSSAKENTNESNILVTKQNNVTTITLNRPKKKNALTSEMYDEIVAALKNAADDEESVITVITGAGDYYCSGNDLSNFIKGAAGGNIEEIARSSKALLKRFVAAFIDFPKPLIAAVNGPAVGVSVTTMALCDLVYTTDKATFSTPFSSLGQSPEGCSSYIFPKLMGYSKANEILLFNKKITAMEAKAVGLVAEVFPESAFAKEVGSRVQEMSKLPKHSLIYSKKLIRDAERELLHKVNEEECERLVERWQSPDCMNAVMAFLQRKSAL